ncbi:MAG: Ig-like domain-containing protein [Verrucomicrobia bacterium]|nr:Ig-like domain-containing protein [Verrucomicrobiota bacterium]
MGTYSYAASSQTFQMTLYYTKFNGYAKPKTPLGYFTGKFTATASGRHLEGTMQFAGAEGPSGDTYNWDANAPPPPDVQPPVVTISSPANGWRLFTNNGVVTVLGTASDNVGVAQVQVNLNNSGWHAANGTTGWHALMTLAPGPNTVSAYAVDGAGNKSPTNSVTFTYVVSAPLTVLTNGVGTISPSYNGQQLEIGKSYTMTASGQNGWGFTNWSGGTDAGALVVLTNKPILQFTMVSNLILQANFTDIQKPTLAITNPTPSGIRVSNAVVDVKGWAKDNDRVDDLGVATTAAQPRHELGVGLRGGRDREPLGHRIEPNDLRGDQPAGAAHQRGGDDHAQRFQR